jgi:hypothetical protein
MFYATLKYPKSLDDNWPAIRARNFVKALGITPGRDYTMNMTILASKAKISIEELIIMNPIGYAQKDDIKISHKTCQELLGRKQYRNFYLKW